VHHGRVEEKTKLRKATLDAAYDAHPERFVRGRSKPLELASSYINRPLAAVCTTDPGRDGRGDLNQRRAASPKAIPQRRVASRHLPGPAASPGVRGSAPVLSPMSAVPVRSACLRRSPGSARAGGVKGGPPAERSGP
jgi:hypothetical protein